MGSIGTMVPRFATADELLRCAVWYARRGWWVFPVAGKIPLTDRGFKDATAAEVRIPAMFADARATGIGVACGMSDLLVVDCDGEEGMANWADLCGKHGGHEPTMVAETGGGGLHVYFEGEGPSSAAKLAKRVDTRGAGGYVVAPPSRHESGTPYRWRDPRAPLAPAPGWMLDLLRKPEREFVAGVRRRVPIGQVFTTYGRAALENLVDAVLHAPEGERNNQLNVAAYSAGRLSAAGEIDQLAARQALVDAAMIAGLSHREAESTFTSGFWAGYDFGPSRRGLGGGLQ